MKRTPEERLERATLFALAWVAGTLLAVTHYLNGGACQ
jgi:hypothetical protein